MPEYVLLTEARRSDVSVAQKLVFNPETIVVVDRGYNDYALFGRWAQEGVYFVTRLKERSSGRLRCSAEPQYRFRPDDSADGRASPTGLPLPAPPSCRVGRGPGAADRPAE